MDTRRSPGSTERREPELGTDTVPVELVDLQTVGSPKQRQKPVVLLVVAAAAVLAFAAVMLLVRPPLPAPTVRPTDAAAFVTSPPSIPVSSISPTLAPTPAPTKPPWTWQASPLQGFPGESVRDLWGLPGSGQFVAALRRAGVEDGAVHPLLASLDGATWARVTIPSVDWAIQAGTVVDDDLYLVGQVGGTGAIEVWATNDARTWEHMAWLDQMLADADRVVGLARTTFGWVAVAERNTNDGLRRAVLFSADEQTWTTIDVPGVELDNAGVIATDGNANGWALVYAEESEDGVAYGVFGSTDGQAWWNVTLPVANGFTTDIAAGRAGFVVVGRDELDAGAPPTAWLSDLASDWRATPVSEGRGPAAGAPNRVIETDAGPLAVSDAHGLAWLYVNDRWREFPVAPRLAGPFVAVAAIGDRIVAFAEPRSGPLEAMVGSLGALAAD